MKKGVKLLLLFMLSNFCAFSQKDGNDIFLEMQSSQKIQFYIYQPTEQIKYKVESEMMVDRKTPESLVQSYFSATNANWVKNDYLEKKSSDSRDEKHFATVRGFSKQKNYIKLLSKYSFTHEGQSFCYVFYLLELEGIDFKFPTVLSCVKQNGRWYLFNLANQAKIREILMTVKPDIFKLVLDGNKTEDDYLNSVILKSKIRNEGLSIPLFYDEVKKWTNDNEIEKLKKYTNY